MAAVLDSVEVFVAAVEAGGFAAAAERLRLTRSAVAKAIARIEGRLDVRLFHRTTRRLTVTEDGQLYYERCVRALEELRAGEAALESGRREVAGRLRVSVQVQFGRRCVAPVLANLAAQHPKLELELSFSDRTVDLIEERFDLAIRHGDVADGVGLMTRQIGLERPTVYAAPSYLTRHGAPERLEDLPHHVGVAYGRAGRIEPWRFRGGARSLLIEAMPPSRLIFDDIEAVADAAEAGHGLAWLPSWVVGERIRSGALVPVLKDVPSIEVATRALWRQTPHLPLRVRLAIDALAAALRGGAER